MANMIALSPAFVKQVHWPTPPRLAQLVAQVGATCRADVNRLTNEGGDDIRNGTEGELRGKGCHCLFRGQDTMNARSFDMHLGEGETGFRLSGRR